MIGSGLLAVPALAGSAADGVAALFGWPRGLDRPPRKAKRFYVILAAILLIGLLVNFLGFNPIQALVLSAALNGVLTPPILVLLLLIANKRDVMGRRTNGVFLNLLGWGTTVMMAVAALGLLLTTL
jgi:Mn2+/Fe2+ NRAMP family transporter